MKTNRIPAKEIPVTTIGKCKGRLRSFSIATITVIVMVLVLASHGAQAAPGDLDPRFGSGGKVFTDFSGNSDYGFGVALQRDGKIILAGQSGVDQPFHSALARYNRNGSLDQTFGTGGKVIAALDPDGDELSDIALQPDGKIVAAGSLVANNTTAFLVARFNPDGSLDQAFGSGGSVFTSFNDSSTQANAVVLQPDGKIVLVGVSGAGPYSELNDFALARYNSDGSLDQGFGNGGKLKTHFRGVFNTGSNATAAVLQPDGKLVVVGGYKNERTPHEFALARYNADGSLDATFGSGGKLTTKAGSGDAFALAVALQADGRIVLAGYSEDTQDHDFALACYTPSGTLDQSFGNGGITATDFSGSTDDIAYAMALQRDGKLIVAGRTGDYPEFDFALARYSSNGQLDQSFGNGGKVISDFGNGNQAYAVALQRNGRIVAAGISNPSLFNLDFALARYLGH